MQQGVGSSNQFNTCGVASHVFKGLTQLWTSIICPRRNLDEWHSKSCLMGDCDICDGETLSFYLEEYESIEIVCWKCIGYEVMGITNEGKEKKALKID